MTRDDDKRKEGLEPADEKVKQIAIDPVKFQHLRRQLQDNQNLPVGMIAGLVAAAAGATAWGLITSLTGYQIGYMAIGVGFLVGIAVGKFGQGIDKIFGVVGAALALLGCLAGNVLAACFAVAKANDLSVFFVLKQMDASGFASTLRATFNPMDLLFYGFAVAAGYKRSIRGLTAAELERVRAG